MSSPTGLRCTVCQHDLYEVRAYLLHWQEDDTEGCPCAENDAECDPTTQDTRQPVLYTDADRSYDLWAFARDYG